MGIAAEAQQAEECRAELSVHIGFDDAPVSQVGIEGWLGIAHWIEALALEKVVETVDVEVAGPAVGYQSFLSQHQPKYVVQLLQFGRGRIVVRAPSPDQHPPVVAQRLRAGAPNAPAL